MAEFIVTESYLENLVNRHIQNLSPKEIHKLAIRRAVRLDEVTRARRKMGWPTPTRRGSVEYMVK